MANPSAVRMFNQFVYQKPMVEVRNKMREKVDFLRSKIEERQGRIVKLRTEYDISDQDLIQLLQEAMKREVSNMPIAASTSYTLPSQGSDTSDVRMIAAGVVQNLMTENRLADEEKESVEKLEQIIRNLKPVQYHAEGNGSPYTVDYVTLSSKELDFLGF